MSLDPPLTPSADLSPAADPVAPPVTFATVHSAFALWLRSKPLQALLSVALFGTCIYFFGYFKPFTDKTFSTAEWAWISWDPVNNQEHAVAILPIAIFLLWYHREKIATAPKRPSSIGLLFVCAGIVCFLLAVRTVQPRLAILAFPLLILGCVWFLWGRVVARVFLFPCAFLLFMIPIGGFVQGTVSLQILVSSVCNVLSALIGVKIEVSGTTIRSLDGSFNFEIAEGCSGVRSLMAMITLTALYVHFTQRQLWKKVLIFTGSVVFALVGNIGRIFTVILVAKFIDPGLAGGIYHDYSGFIFFPIAVAAMIGFSNLLNRDWYRWSAAALAPKPATPTDKKDGNKPSGPISYDY